MDANFWAFYRLDKAKPPSTAGCNATDLRELIVEQRGNQVPFYRIRYNHAGGTVRSSGYAKNNTEPSKEQRANPWN